MPLGGAYTGRLEKSGLPMFCPPPFRRAFTLIELLVVIAIISVLAAILFPVLAQARGKARQAACLSNMKQVGLAVLQYNQDHDEGYPVSFYKLPSGACSAPLAPVSWPRLISPYVKETGVYRCPSVAETPGSTPGTGDTPETRYPVTYAYNHFLGGNFCIVTGSSLPATIKAASTVMLVDGGAAPEPGVDPALWEAKRSPTPADPSLPDTIGRSPHLLVHAGTFPPISTDDYGAPLARHQGRVNVLWADGHAKSAKVEEFYKLPGEAEDPDRPAGYSQWWSRCLEPEFGCRE